MIRSHHQVRESIPQNKKKQENTQRFFLGFGFYYIFAFKYRVMVMIAEIRTIVFDLGGVLIDYDLQPCLDAFRALGIPEPEKFVNPYRQHGIFQKLEDGSETPEAFYRYVDRWIGHPVDPRKIDEAWCSFLIDIPDYKLDMLLALRRRGYRLFMLSNTNVIMFEWMRQHVFRKQGRTVDDYFDRLFLSYEMGKVKPDPAIFEQMIAESGISPDETLLIDDGPANIATAASLGFHVYEARVHEDFRSLFEYYPLKS